MVRKYKPKRAIQTTGRKPSVTTLDDGRARLIRILALDDKASLREWENLIAAAMVKLEHIKLDSARDRLREARRRIALDL